MNNNNDNGALLFGFVAAFMLFGVAFSLARLMGVPSSIAVTAVVIFVFFWLLPFLGALYVRFRMEEELIDYTWPFFMLGLWLIFTPFLDHWASPVSSSPFYESDPAFYGTALFQGVVGLLILGGGYGAIFRWKSSR